VKLQGELAVRRRPGGDAVKRSVRAATVRERSTSTAPWRSTRRTGGSPATRRWRR